MGKFKPLAVNFHGHTDFSLDGGSTCSHKIINAANQGRPADCVTDHGIMSAIATHHLACQKLYDDKKTPFKVQSIHGIEAYIIDWNRPPKVYKNGKVEPKYYHLTIHFKTQKAYEYFCSLTPKMEARAVVKFGESKPLMTLDELKEISGEITLGSGCMVGPVLKNIVAGRSDWAIQNYELLRAIAGPGNFFLEAMPHMVQFDWQKPVRDKDKRIVQKGEYVNTKQRMDEDAIDAPFPVDECGGLDLQKPLNEFIVKMSQKYGDPIIVSLDDHFATPEDKIVQSIRISNGSEDWQFHNTLAAFDSDYCFDVFQKQIGLEEKEFEKWVDNGYMFLDLFKGYKFATAQDRALLPQVSDIYEVSSVSSKDKLFELIKKHGRMPDESHKNFKIYKDRLDYEISVLADNGKMDFIPYFLLLEDVTGYLKSVGCTNSARGSAGGSLISYLLGISIADPIVYNLPFERFLTLGRIVSGSLPDIDLDVESREVVIEYLQKKYGDRFALISSDMSIRLKYAIKDVERAALGLVTPETEEMCKKIYPPAGVNDKDWLLGTFDKNTGAYEGGFIESEESGAVLLKAYIEKYPERWEIILKCLGITRSRGVHAGGIVVTPGPVANYVPVIKTDKGMASAYEMRALEAVGGIKYDILGLDTLRALGIAMRQLRADGVADLQWGEFPYDPDVFYEVIHKDKLAAVFQLNTKLVRPFVKKTKPSSINDIAALTALCRPGALDAASPNPEFEGSAADYYVAVSQGKERAFYIHDDVRHIFAPTNGICVFQEQLLQVFRDIGGYTYADAEEVRRAVGKKKRDLMELHLGNLEKKCIERGWTQEQAKNLSDTLVASSRYSFNLSHSVAYAIVAYNCCYMKYHHPLYFWKGILTVFQDDFDKINEYLSEAGKYIGEVSVTKSDIIDWRIVDGKLIPPLSFVKGCGEKGVENLMNVLQIAGLRSV